MAAYLGKLLCIASKQLGMLHVVSVIVSFGVVGGMWNQMA